MIVHYGYEDGSGKYYVSIDTEKCDACNCCIEQCPEKILTIDTVMIDIEEKQVAVIGDSHRNKIAYICAACHHQQHIPCEYSCKKGAITTVWQKKQP